MKVCFETFGCRLNRSEALQQEAEYLAKGWEGTEKHSDADLFIVRGCSVTRRAQHDCEKLIAHLKAKYPHVPLHICGCLKNVDATSSSRRNKEFTPPDRRDGDVASTAVPTRTARAYLKCQDGCSGKCTFCIVPKFRGASVSVPFEDLVDKAKRFIDAGYHEIVLTGCNLALYASQGKRFPDLVAALAELAQPPQPPTPDLQPSTFNLQPSTSNLQPSTCRIRIGSLEPGACALETVEAMAEHTNVCRFLHIPVQSGSDNILKAMGRPYRIEDIATLVERARNVMPLVGIGCDLMTGFPGETEADFLDTKRLCERLAFSNAHIFPFSERPGTIAAELPNAVPEDVRRERAHVLSGLAHNARKNAARKFIGRSVEMLVEDEANFKGWTGEYFSCKITNAEQGSVKRKQLVRVHVMDTREDHLRAIMI